MIYDEKEHRNRDPFPSRRDFQKVFFYSQGKCFGPFKPGDCSDFEKDKKYFKEVITDEDALKEATKAWRKKDCALKEKYKTELFAICGHNNTRINEKLWSKAWEDGHSSGYNEVEMIFTDLVDLVDEILKLYDEDKK